MKNTVPFPTDVQKYGSRLLCTHALTRTCANLYLKLTPSNKYASRTYADIAKWQVSMYIRNACDISKYIILALHITFQPSLHICSNSHKQAPPEYNTLVCIYDTFGLHIHICCAHLRSTCAHLRITCPRLLIPHNPNKSCKRL